MFGTIRTLVKQHSIFDSIIRQMNGSGSRSIAGVAPGDTRHVDALIVHGVGLHHVLRSLCQMARNRYPCAETGVQRPNETSQPSTLLAATVGLGGISVGHPYVVTCNLTAMDRWERKRGVATMELQT